MKHSFIWIGVLAAASGAALAAACSSSSDGGGTPSTADSGTSGTSGSQGTSGTPSTSGASGTSGTMPDKDTCTMAGSDNTCQCSCGITGQTENLSLHCKQPSADTGKCPTVCCTGPVDSGTSGSSGTSGDSGGLDSGGD